MSGRFKNNNPKPTRDAQTGTEYRSRNQAGRAVAPQFGLPLDNFVWFEVLKRAASSRFIDVNTSRPILPDGRVSEI